MSGKQTKALRLEAVERYQAGESATEICRSLGKSRQWLYKWLQRKEELGSDNGKNSELDNLTIREREVLQLIAEGHTNKEIAYLLGVTVKTVEAHRANLMSKLDTHTTASLTLFAVERGITATHE